MTTTRGANRRWRRCRALGRCRPRAAGSPRCRSGPAAGAGQQQGGGRPSPPSRSAARVAAQPVRPARRPRRRAPAPRGRRRPRGRRPARSRRGRAVRRSPAARCRARGPRAGRRRSRPGEKCRDLLGRHRVRDLGEAHPAGLLAGLAGGGAPLGERLGAAVALPLRDAAGRRPRARSRRRRSPSSSRRRARPRSPLGSAWTTVMRGCSGGSSGDRRPAATTSRSLPSAAATTPSAQRPRAVGEDDVLAGPQPLHGDGVPALRARRGRARRRSRPGVEVVDHEDRCGHPASPVRPAPGRQRCPRGGQFGHQHLHQLSGGQLAGHPVALARPQRHALRVARLGGGLAQRRR